MWFEDPFWREAAAAAVARAGDFDWILAPHEFHALGSRFRPLEYSESPPPGRIAFLCHKDAAGNLSTAFRQRTTSPDNYLFANSVFVMGEPGGAHKLGEWSTHLPSWFERLGASAKTDVGHAARERTAILVGASGFGNVGDDLLAEVLSRQLLKSGDFDNVRRAYFNLTRQDLAGCAALFVGGGGLIYAEEDGRSEWQNLANYFKFPFWAGEAGLPCHFVALGTQGEVDCITRDEPTARFFREAARKAASFSVRDRASLQFVRKAADLQNVRVGADPVFCLEDPKPRDPAPSDGRLLLLGEIFRYPLLADWLISPAGMDILRKHGATFGLMSDDDVPHFERLHRALERDGVHLDLRDFRQVPAGDLVAEFAKFGRALTTRFHGMVLCLLAGVEFVVFDRHGGKKDRLVREAFPELGSMLFHEETACDGLGDILAQPLLAASDAALRSHTMTSANHISPAKADRPSAAGRRGGDSRELADQLLTTDGEIKLCWAAASPASNGFANLGDALSAYVVANLAGMPVRHSDFESEETRLFGVGSIGHGAKGGHAVIWGTGCYRPDILIGNTSCTKYDVLAVRGTISRECLLSVGINAPERYGEPVWLLPSMFNEEVEKRYEVGIITHISDHQHAGPGAPMKESWVCFDIPDHLRNDVVVIDTWHEPTLEAMMAKLRLILSCRRIASRSFHGVVIAETYGVPCLPVCCKPGVPSGAFRSEDVKLAQLDRRTLEFLNHCTRRPQWFYGQRRGIPTDWDKLVSDIDAHWSPTDYDTNAMLDSFPFPMPADPMAGRVPTHSSLKTLAF
jgi:polysaccharide pyruvyl transferase WcaK-like protein